MPAASDLYLFLATGIGRAITYLERRRADENEPDETRAWIPPLVDGEIDPNPITLDLRPYDLARLLSPTFAARGGLVPGTKPHEAGALALAGLIRTAELTSGPTERRDLRLAWIDTELRSAGSSLEQARKLLGRK
ncbi:hypothetical protein ACQP2U_43605 (plasmid) [Nocardia sp. CA-084685]|uniref:hypothetical protein n=1 Tax=Nocardia sp. CA-084685 TaxID=3239970 RepID=UPI003D994A3D